MIRIVCDPYRVSNTEGIHVQTLADELAAFRRIADILRNEVRGDTDAPLTFVVETTWEHFRSYRGLIGVDLQIVSPRGLLKNRLRCEPSDWLTDSLIRDLQLLESPISEDALVDEDWASMVCSILCPGISEVESLEGMLFLLASGPSQLFPTICPEEVFEWLVRRFETLASLTIPIAEIVSDLCIEFKNASSPVLFAQDFSRRRALAPLIRSGTNQVLCLPNIHSDSPRLLALSKYLPLLFPLPESMHSAISDSMTQAMRHARLTNPANFESAVLALNAIWNGVTEEIGTWLDINPRSMTAVAVSHLKSLPGYESNSTIQRLVRSYAPPESVPQWDSLDDSFDIWVTAYSKFISTCFFRRDLPSSDKDPATAFGNWVKDNPSLIFNHPERGYRYFAARVQRALADRRPVIVILIDALAIHLVELLSGYLADKLSVFPSSTSYIFAPLPTITEVCKEAILTGRLPASCNGNLKEGITEVYGLDSSQFELTMHWRNAERMQVTANTKLLVYRDNRIDDQLHSLPTYKSLTDECPAIFARLSRLIERWVGDMEQLHGQQPLLLITADHGFTFGAPCGNEMALSNGLSGGQRCIPFTQNQSLRIEDPSMTFIDRSVFHLRQDYLAVKGRHLGHDTSLGWHLSHGGLLPEEVIIPVLEWFGNAESIMWPELSFANHPFLDQQKWNLTAVVRNPAKTPITGLTLSLNVAQCEKSVFKPIPRIPSGDQVELSFEVPVDREFDSPVLLIDYRMTIVRSDLNEPKVQSGQCSLVKAKQLSVRTKDQADFEGMF